MPSWKKVILSGSNAALNSLTVSNGITGSLFGTASWAVSASQATTASYASFTLTASSSQNAQDILIYVKNVTGAQIDKGKVVRISGATGDNALISTASYESDGVSANTLGITNQDIPHDSFGYVITEGTLVGINTNAFSAGQLLYLGATGSIIGTAPVAPLHAVRLGQVLRVQTNNGSMYVRIDNGYELGELHDVVDTTTTSSYGDLLVKSGSVWINSRQLTGSYGLTGSLNATSFTGSLFGTASFATTASFLSSTTNAFIQNGNSFGATAVLGTNDNNSLALETNATTRMFISSSGNVGIGTITPSASLQVENNLFTQVIVKGTETTRAAEVLVVNSADKGLNINVTGPTYASGIQNSARISPTGVGMTSIGIGTSRSSTTASFTVNTNTNRVGINKETPTEALDVSGSAIVTGSLNVTAGITGSLFGTSSWAVSSSRAVSSSYAVSSSNALTASFVVSSSYAVSSSNALTASFVNTLNQSVLITGSATIGATSAGASENTLTLGPSLAGGAGEGGQLGLNAAGGTYTSASMIDNWQNQFRLLRGTNAGSDALVAQWSMHTKQMQLPAYTGASSFPGTATANLAVDSGGNIITVSTSGGSVFPYTGNAVITGSLTTTGIIYAQPNGGMYFQGGDDAALYDINVANTMGIYGLQTVTEGAIKLGSDGPVLYGSGSRLGIGTTTPTLGTLQINGNVYATSFTGSLLGTASYATQALSASFTVSSSRAVSASMAILAPLYLPLSGGTMTGDIYAAGRTFQFQDLVLGVGTTQGTIKTDGTKYIGMFPTNAVESTRFLANGNVMHGTTFTDAGYRLQISASSAVSGALQVIGTSVMTGSLTVTSGITGSLFGTASRAVSASWAPAPTNTFLQGGNSFGTTASLGTNDNTPLHFETSGSTRMVIISDGRVGIGTTNPQGALDVFGGNSRFGQGNNGYVVISDDNIGGELGIVSDLDETIAIKYSNGTFQYGGGAVGSAPIIVSQSRVGINTPSPIFDLDVNSQASRFGTGANGYILLSDDTFGQELGMITGDDEVLAIKFSDNTFRYGGGNPGSEPLIVSASNVGIGTATPNAKLDVNGNAIITGSLTVTGRITAEEFYTEFVSSSIIYQSGSTKFGDTSDDVMSVTGSIKVQGSITGSLQGTASYATQALSASWAPATTTAATASFVTSSNVYGPNGSNSILSSSFAISSSYAVSASNALTASFVVSSSYAVSSSNALTASFVVSSSYAISSSNALTASFVVSSSYAISASSAVSSSRAVSSSYAVSASNALTASFVVSSSYAISSSNALTASFTSNVNGTTNYVARFTGANTLSSSAIYDTGTNIIIGGTSPAARFTVTPNGTGTGINGTAIYAYSNGGPTIDAGAANSSSIVATNNSTNSSTLVAQNIGSGPIFSLKNNADVNVLHALNNGRIGLGNITPNANLDVSGSAIITGSLRVISGITGSLQGTASYATQALSASWAPATTTAATASFVTSSNVYGPNGSNSILSASFAISSSNAATASWATNVVNNGVTSVSASGTVSGITLGGGPITSTGTLTLSGTVSGLTNSNLSGTAGITNANLATPSLMIGTTNIALGATGSTLAGLTSVAATTFTGALTGNASTATSASFASTASFLNGGTTNAFIQNGNSFGTTALIGTNDNQPLAFETNGSTRMFISSSGNVGIGTTTPSASLHIAKGDSSLALFGPNTSYGGRLYVGASPSTITSTAAQVISTDGNLHLDPATSSKTYINYYSQTDTYINAAGGNVGIGTTSPGSYKLNVAGGQYGTYLKGGDLGTGSDILRLVDASNNTKYIARGDGKHFFTGDTDITGTLTATVKSFIIDHPTKKGKKLQYGVLEGPEHSVYVRGRLTNENTIVLPDHWHGLVHEDTITVNLTSIGKKQDLWVEEVNAHEIKIGSENKINCFYTVFAERKDIEKLITEFDK